MCLKLNVFVCFVCGSSCDVVCCLDVFLCLCVLLFKDVFALSVICYVMLYGVFFALVCVCVVSNISCLCGFSVLYCVVLYGLFFVYMFSACVCLCVRLCSAVFVCFCDLLCDVAFFVLFVFVCVFVFFLC